MTISEQRKLSIGVLALQGDFRNHREVLEALGHRVVEVRLPEDLKDVDALVFPGGESTAISKLMSSSGLFQAIERRLHEGALPVFGTCAGMILSAEQVADGTPDQRSLGIFDAIVRRNGIGRQIASCEVDVPINGLDSTFRAVFIRPPVVEKIGPSVEVLGTWQGKPVLCAQGLHMFATFHPEVTGDSRIHQLFVERLKA